MKRIYVPILIIIISLNIAAQTETHKWQPIVVDTDTPVWFDASMTDTVTTDRFLVWILENQKPPLELDGIASKIYKVKTLYAINLEEAKYGIAEVVYYNIGNRELARYSYDLNPYDDTHKFAYPVLRDSYMHKFLLKYYDMKGIKVD